MKTRTILYGVCGIGSGHAQRQLPLIEHFAKNARIVIFAYDESYNFYSEHFKNNRNITVCAVAVPFYVGSKDGIDFEATEKLERNKKDYEGINGYAIAKVEEIIGLPDLVISDYEPVSAQYAYEHHVPLITIDQQSKYFLEGFSKELNGETYADEVARLKTFFPTATARIACSFFNVEDTKNGMEVIIFPPILRESIMEMKNIPTTPSSVLVYLSSQQEFTQSLKEIVGVLSLQTQTHFHIFAQGEEHHFSHGNISFYKHGDKRFYDILKNCAGIISTAGHTLLSEALYLNIPMYVIPFSIYEQQMNAEVIDKNGFGVKSETINKEKLEFFISNLDQFRKAIKDDIHVLMRGNGKEKIIEYIETKI